MPRIATIDADTATLELYEQLCTDAGWDTLSCPDAESAYQRIRDAEPSAIILDLRLSTSDAGWAVLRSLKTDTQLSETPVLVCTADTRVVQRCAEDLQGLGCSVLAKPFDINVLLALLRQAVEARSCAHPDMDGSHRLAQLDQRYEKHLQRTRALVLEAEERLAESRRLVAESYRGQQRAAGARS
jgi:DNA-binding response OmpR family regulator